MMPYTVEIRNNATGEVRSCAMEVEWRPGDLEWWTEGNMACDCNRALRFHGPLSFPSGVEYPCGETAYTVICAHVGGQVIPIDGV